MEERITRSKAIRLKCLVVAVEIMRRCAGVLLPTALYGGTEWAMKRRLAPQRKQVG